MSDILKILENSPNRYDKTIKRKFLRVESLSLVIGFICAYVTMLAMIIFSNNLPDAIKKMMNSSKYSYIVVFYVITIGIGNIIGGIISNGLYKNIAPKKKYSHYSKSSGKSVYIDDIEGYMNFVKLRKYEVEPEEYGGHPLEEGNKAYAEYLYGKLSAKLENR